MRIRKATGCVRLYIRNRFYFLEGIYLFAKNVVFVFIYVARTGEFHQEDYRCLVSVVLTYIYFDVVVKK